MAVRKPDHYTVNSKLQVKFSDFLSDFDINPDTGDLYRNINDFAIKESLKNLILTDQGERPFQPTIGSNVRQMLFNNIDAPMALMLKRTIEETISNHEPRVVVRDVTVIPDDSHNVLSITIFYTTINSPGQVQDLSINLLTRVR